MYRLKCLFKVLLKSATKIRAPTVLGKFSCPLPPLKKIVATPLVLFGSNGYPWATLHEEHVSEDFWLFDFIFPYP